MLPWFFMILEIMCCFLCIEEAVISSLYWLVSGEKYLPLALLGFLRTPSNFSICIIYTFVLSCGRISKIVYFTLILQSQLKSGSLICFTQYGTECSFVGFPNPAKLGWLFMHTHWLSAKTVYCCLHGSTQWAKHEVKVCVGQAHWTLACWWASSGFLM